MTDTEAKLQSKRHLSGIWLVPIVAAFLGIYLLYEALRAQGPELRIHFDTAAGLEVSKTLIKYRNVTLGKVSAISLDESLQGIWVTADMSPGAKPLIREDTEFWVVRPRISSAGISGLGTLVSGAYIELGPGTGEPTSADEFIGLDDIPYTPAGTAGVRIRLFSEASGALSVGDPVLHMGYQVGVVETAKLDIDNQEMHYAAFIEAPYDTLVSDNTYFWNASGVSAQFNSEGIKLSIDSLQTLIIGGVSFGLPAGEERGDPVSMNTQFRLHPNQASAYENPYNYFQHYVVDFKQSLRGLNPGAEVTFRGIRIGRVEKIMLAELSEENTTNGSNQPIPVLIRIEPGALALGDTPEALTELQQSVAQAVLSGLRASLVSGNILTGALYVDLNYYPDEADAGLGDFQGHAVIPSITGGLGQIQHQLTQLLKKANALPLEQTVTATNSAINELRRTLSELRTMVASEGAQNLPDALASSLNEVSTLLRGLSGSAGFTENLNRSLTELNSTLRSLQQLTKTIEQKPNSIIFPVDHGDDPIPKAGTP